MKKIVPFLIFCFFSSIAIAQLAGYKGRRLNIGYSANVSPAILSPLANTIVGDRNDLNKEYVLNVAGLNITHGVNIDYVIKRSTSFCVSVQVLKTGLAYKNEYKLSDELEKKYQTNSILYLPADDRPMQMKLINLTMGFKFFRGYLAPMGKYLKLDLLYFMEKISFDPDGFSPSHVYGLKYTPPEDHYSFHNIGIGLSMGKQRILFDRLIVDTGFKIGVLPAAFFTLIDAADITEFFSSNLEYQHQQLDYQIKQKAIRRMQGSQLINFHIGIGFLAF